MGKIFIHDTNIMINKQTHNDMAEILSLRARLMAMKVGDSLTISRDDYSPSVVGTTTYRVRRDAPDDRRYQTKSTDNGVEVRRIS
jgi:hypothetical protein